MARTPIPDALTRRHLLEGELAPERALRIAEAYLEEGRRVEALPFLARAEARERLGELGREAVAEGDAFLLRAVCAALGEEAPTEQWRALGEAARAAGKDVYAQDAQRLLGGREDGP